MKKIKEGPKSLKRFVWLNKDFKKMMEKENLKYDNKFMRFVVNAYSRVRTDRDLYFALTGSEGEGKSTLAIHLGYAIDPNFSLEKNVLYSPDAHQLKVKMEYRKLVENGKEIPEEALPPYSVLIIDEAIKILYKLEQWSGVQRFLKKLFALARTENKIIILNIPSFLDMGTGFRNRMLYWIDIFYRGFAIVEGRSTNKYSNDKYNLFQNKQAYDMALGRRKYAEVTPEIHKSIVSHNSKNYVASLTFPKLPEPIIKKYNHYKNSYDYSDIEISSKEKENKKIEEIRKRYENKISILYWRLSRLAYKFKREYDISYKIIGKNIGMSSNEVGKLARDYLSGKYTRPKTRQEIEQLVKPKVMEDDKKMEYIFDKEEEKATKCRGIEKND